MEESSKIKNTIQRLIPQLRILIFFPLLVGIITAIFTLFMTDYYKSSTVFYAASPDLSSPAPLSVSQEKVHVFGSGEDMDRLLAIAHSQVIYEKLIDSFKLYDHYRIDTTKKHSRHKVLKKLQKHYTVRKTRFRGIEVIAEDRQPERATAMANAARDLISNHARVIIKESQLQTLNNYSDNIKFKSIEVRGMQDSLSMLKRKFGIIKSESQGEILATHASEVELNTGEIAARINKMRQLAFPVDSIRNQEAKLAGLTQKKKLLDNQLDNFNEGVEIVEALENNVLLANSQLGLLKERHQQLLATHTSSFKTLHIVEEASIPNIKSKPVRSLIVLASMAATLAALLIFYLLKMAWIGSDEE